MNDQIVVSNNIQFQIKVNFEHTIHELQCELSKGHGLYNPFIVNDIYDEAPSQLHVSMCNAIRRIKHIPDTLKQDMLNTCYCLTYMKDGQSLFILDQTLVLQDSDYVDFDFEHGCFRIAFVG